jgi:hypothetical protein
VEKKFFEIAIIDGALPARPAAGLLQPSTGRTASCQKFLFTVPRYISSSTLIVRKGKSLFRRDIAMAVYSS